MGRNASLGLWLGIVACLLLPGCFSSTTVEVTGGNLTVNPRLREDRAASAGMLDGRFFADGQCDNAGNGSGSDLRECRYTSPVRPDTFGDGNAFLRRLRRAEFLWVEAEGFPTLSYEIIAKGISIVEYGNPSNVFANMVDVGACSGFPAIDPETRQPVPGLENSALAKTEEFLDQIDAQVHACSAQTQTPVSESLDPQTSNCSDSSVRTLAGNRGVPDANPLCIDLQFGEFANDVSYSLLPHLRSDTNAQQLWPELKPALLPLLPHIKTVPIGGTRTISRPLTHEPDAPSNHFYWRVGQKDSGWTENFSPNVVVQRARVRRGTWTEQNRDYLRVEELAAGIDECHVRYDTTHTEFDIPLCDLSKYGNFRVTPAYRFDFLEAQPIDDDLSLKWSVRIPPSALEGNDELFLELDLTAISSTAKTGAALMVDPPGRDLGSLRTGPSTSPQPGFTLRNLGPVSAWVSSIALEGPDAAEFGSIQVERTPSPAPSAGAAPPATITAPFILRAGSTAEVKLLPAFRTMGEKHAEVVVTWTDVVRSPHSIRGGIVAHAVSPVINVHPSTVFFSAQRGSTGSASARRFVLLTNDGPIAFRRNSVTITGANAGDFRLLRSEHGLAASSPSQPLTIGPGESETYELGFYPNAAGNREAMAVIDTNEGQLSIGLRGSCYEGCQQPPTLTLEEPSFVPAPSKALPTLKLKTPWKYRLRKKTLTEPSKN